MQKGRNSSQEFRAPPIAPVPMKRKVGRPPKNPAPKEQHDDVSPTNQNHHAGLVVKRKSLAGRKKTTVNNAVLDGKQKSPPVLKHRRRTLATGLVLTSVEPK